MAARLSLIASEGSAYIIRLSFYDEDGIEVSPDTIKWTLVDGFGLSVNGRVDVVKVPSFPIDIILSDADIAVSGTQSRERKLIIEATYTSMIGSPLTLNDSAWFSVDSIDSVV